MWAVGGKSVGKDGQWEWGTDSWGGGAMGGCSGRSLQAVGKGSQWEEGSSGRKMQAVRRVGQLESGSVGGGCRQQEGWSVGEWFRGEVAGSGEGWPVGGCFRGKVAGSGEGWPVGGWFSGRRVGQGRVRQWDTETATIL